MKGRATEDAVEDGQLDVAARYYHRDNDFSLFFMSLSGSAAANLDPDHQLLLGGDNGLRGYPLRYALGDKSILLTLEERFCHPARVLSPPADRRRGLHGRRQGVEEGPSPASHLGVLKDLGFGLRFGHPARRTPPSRARGRRRSFDIPGGGFHPQILVTTGETF